MISILEGDAYSRCRDPDRIKFAAAAVVLTAGTFLSGLVHVGLQNYAAGRAGDPPAKRLGGACGN